MSIHGAEILVTDEDMVEVLLGRPLLKSMGFDLSNKLQNFSLIINDMGGEGLRAGISRL